MANAHLTGHENPWRTVEHARNWLARMDREPPDRSEELLMVVKLLPFESRDASVRVLELGAGHGLLTAEVLEAFPNATLLALDLSPVMVEEGPRRLVRFGARVSYRQWDLEEAGWPDGVDGPFDAVVSSLAIHHLHRRRKVELARQLLERLQPGGVFLNLDYTVPASESLRKRYEQAQARMSGGEQHGHGAGGGGGDGDHGPEDHGHGGHGDGGHGQSGRGDGGHGQNLAGGHATDSLFDQLDDLRAAGFVDVDVFWKRLGLALFGGTKGDPERPRRST
jgi:tRNA (cmo5U34)-methyltransferase